MNWLWQRFSESSKEQQAEIVSLCCAIWNARNKLVWSNTKFSVNFVVSLMKQYLAEWKHAQPFSSQALYQVVELEDGADKWVKPLNDEVKITVDAAIFAEEASYGVGMLPRNSSEEVLEGKSKLFQENTQPNVVEPIAVKEALSWSKENRWDKVVLESDCLAVIQAIRSKISMHSAI